MGGYLARRLLQLLLTLLVSTLVIFGAMEFVPGDPILAMFFPRVPTKEVYDSVRTQLGLDKPIVTRYVSYLWRVFHGDLGTSFKQGRSVALIIGENLRPTLELGLAGVLISVVVGVPLGFIAALTRRRSIDMIVMGIALVGVSTPSFWLGIILMLVFSLTLGWFPTSGIGGLRYLVLPGLTLGLYGAGYLARFARSSVLEVKHMDYVTTARAKGLKESIVNSRHVFRNALIPVVTMSGLLAGYMLGGAVIVETVFGRSGIGHVLVNSISHKDFPLVQGILIFTVALFSLANLAVDISYVYLDPRVKY